MRVLRSGGGCKLQRAVLCSVMVWLVPGIATAHGFGRLYNLPVPFWLYAWAAAAALLLSFLMIATLAASPKVIAATPTLDLSNQRWVRLLRRALPALKLTSVLLLLLCIASGWFGNRDPYRNFSMTFFWVVFLLVKAVNKMMPKKEVVPAAPAGPTELDLLKEIRDALRARG